MGLGGLVSSGGQVIQDLWGSNAPPRAILNLHAAPAVKAGVNLSTGLATDVNSLSKDALNRYMTEQPHQEALAGQQAGVLNTLLSRRMAADPNRLLQDVGGTTFGFINPSVVSPLARFDVNYDTLARRARGLNPASVDSTAARLRDARIASGRYYDVAKEAYGALPGLYNQAYNQNAGNEAAAAGYIPQIAGAYESVASRPTTGIMNRINTAGAAGNVARQGVDTAVAGTAGFHQAKNMADRIGAAGQHVGQQFSQDESQMMAPIAGSL